jgi:hypothetical protein
VIAFIAAIGTVKLTDTGQKCCGGFLLCGLQASDFVPHLHGFSSQFAMMV